MPGRRGRSGVSKGVSDGRKPGSLPMVQAQRVFLQQVQRGLGVEAAAAEAGRSHSAVKNWLRTDPLFAERYRQVRAGMKDPEKQAARFAEGRGVPDFPEFCQEYMGQRLFTHQLQWFDVLEGREPRDLHPACTFTRGNAKRMVVNTPVGHAKSTTLTVNYTVWRIVKDPNVKIKIVSKSQRMAEDFLLQVKERLTAPAYARLQDDFGPPGGWQGGSVSWKANRFYVSSSVRDSEQKDPTCEALGVRGQIYGARADLIILDDVVDNLNVAEFDKQIRWIQGMLLNRLGRNGVMLVVGTRIAAQDLYSQLMSEDYYGGQKAPWTYLAQKAVLEFAEDPRDWVTLWPRTDSPEDASLEADEEGLFLKWDGPLLHERRGEVGPTEFARMYQQETVANDLPFKAESIRRCVGSRMAGPLPAGWVSSRDGRGMEGMYVVAGLDPASVGFTAAVCIAVDPDSGMRYVLDVHNEAGMSPDSIKRLLTDWVDRFGVDEWRVERNAFQAFLTRDPEVQVMLANRGCVLVEHTTTGKIKHDPDFGVLAMAVLFDNGLFELPQLASERVRNLVDQLVVWRPDPPKTLKTDLVMALWFAEIRCQQLVVGHRPGRLFTESEFLTPSDRAARRVLDVNRVEHQFRLAPGAMAGQF